VYYYNGAQRYEQFLQVGRLYRALILLGLVLSSERLCVFGLHGTYPGGIGPRHDLLTIVFQCFYSVVWVIRPVKLSPK